MPTDANRSRMSSEPSLIESLRRCTGLADAQLCIALAQRARCTAPTAHLLHAWNAGDIAMPEWVERYCTEWVLELWRDERATCTAHELLQVDRKYSVVLRHYSVADLLAIMRTMQRCDS